MSRLTLCIPGDPIPKGRPRFFRKRGKGKKGGAGGVATFTPKRTLDAEKSLREFAQWRMRGEGLDPFEGPLRVRLAFSRATKRRCDLDNLCKLVLDALNTVAFVDDSQIVEMHATKDHDRTHPRTVVEIEEVTP